MKETIIRSVRAVLLWSCLLLVWLILYGRHEVVVAEERVDWRDFFQDHVRPGLPVAGRFDYPLRPPEGEGSYIVKGFKEKQSLGEWWALEQKDGGKPEPVYSVADGWVTLAEDFQSSWRKVIIVAHRLGDGYPDSAEVLYANLDTMDVKAGDFVKRGQQIGTIRSSDDGDSCMLYLEIREEVGLGLGPGESDDAVGWTKPSAFIRNRRGESAAPDAGKAKSP